MSNGCIDSEVSELGLASEVWDVLLELESLDSLFAFFGFAPSDASSWRFYRYVTIFVEVLVV